MYSYRSALKEHPGCPPEVRLGIGACALKLGDLHTARGAYTRAFELDPNCADALLGLGLVNFSSSNVQQVRAYAACMRLSHAKIRQVACVLQSILCAGCKPTSCVHGICMMHCRSDTAEVSMATCSRARVCACMHSCPQGLADGLKQLINAYRLDPTHVGVLAQLAHYCLVSGSVSENRRRNSHLSIPGRRYAAMAGC